MIERVANAFGKVGFHGAIGIMAVGAIVFVCIFGTVQQPDEGTVLADITVRAFDILGVAVGGLLVGATAVFRSLAGESDKPVEKPESPAV